MKTYYFASKFRSMDFEGMPGVQFRDFRFQTTDPSVAEILRGKKDVNEITSAIEARNAGIDQPDAQTVALAENEAKRSEFAPKVVGGMRTAKSTTKKEKT